MSDGDEIGTSEIVPIKEEENIGSLWSWGSNAYGQLGHSETDLPLYQPTPKQILLSSEKDNNWSTFGYGMYHTAATQGSGGLYTWGSSDFGQSGRNSLMISRSPEQIEGESWSQVKCGDYFTIAMSGHQLYGFGKNDVGQLGTGDRLFYKTPKKISEIYFEKFSCGANYTCGIDTSKKLYSWGSNSHGQLGFATSKPQLSPVLVDTNKWYMVSAGVLHTLAILDSDHSLWGWGSNIYNQLGISGDYKTPTLLDSTKDWRRIACGIYHSLALDKDGYLFSSGYNTHGQLGMNDQEDRSDFSRQVNRNSVIGSGDGAEDATVIFTHIGAIGYFSYGIGFIGASQTKNNSVYFFGDNTYTIVEDQPRYILEPYKIASGYADIARGSCGGVFMMALKSLEATNSVGGDR